MLGQPGSWDKRKTVKKVWLEELEANPSWKPGVLTFFLISFFPSTSPPHWKKKEEKKEKKKRHHQQNNKKLSQNQSYSRSKKSSFKVPRLFFFFLRREIPRRTPPPLSLHHLCERDTHAHTHTPPLTKGSDSVLIFHTYFRISLHWHWKFSYKVEEGRGVMQWICNGQGLI